MKQATNFAILVTTAFYLSVGCLGYSAFGDKAPINLLNVGSSGEGFVNPHWLVDCANVVVMINMLGGYQVGRSLRYLFSVCNTSYIDKWYSCVADVEYSWSFTFQCKRQTPAYESPSIVHCPVSVSLSTCDFARASAC